MDREQQEQANQALHKALRTKLEANRSLKLEDLMGREEREADTSPEGEAHREGT